MIKALAGLVVGVQGVFILVFSAIYCMLCGYAAAIVVSLTIAEGVPWYAWGLVLGIAFGLDSWYKYRSGQTYFATKSHNFQTIGSGIVAGVAYAALIKHNPCTFLQIAFGWSFLTFSLFLGTISAAAGIAEYLDKNVFSRKDAAQ